MDTLVSGLVRTVLGNLNSVALQEIGLAWGLKKELDKLETVLNTIQLVLNDAETKQRKSESLRNWLQKLKDAAYDAENILDEVATEALLRKDDSETGQVRKLNAFLSYRNPLLFKFRIAHKVKSVRGRLDVIADERLKFHLGEGVVIDNRIGDVAMNRQTCSLVNESEIYARNEERDLIIEKVVRGDVDCDHLSVYAICGMGGIGKTTLAQLVYNDVEIEEHFELRIWVCVSDDICIKRLIRAIMESIDGSGCSVSELDPLQRLLQEKLRGKRFLLVLDDIWNENEDLWDGLRGTISCGSKGSVLVVTSRNEKVATMMSTIGIHHVQCLSEEDSWSVFSRRAFAIRERQESYTEEIGKEIVKKCGGVPLAIKSLGSLMRYKSSENEWLAIQESETWQLFDDENGVLPALRLSYDNLPLQLRQCFVYCCIFPKNYVMGEDRLVQLWMANDFLSSTGESDLYLTGRLIFKELIRRSFFQDVTTDCQGNTVCKMHDLMHDLAESVMRHETFIAEHGKMNKFPKTLRHLFMVYTSFEVILPISKSLRSLVALALDKESDFEFLSKQQYVRVLEFSSWKQKFPSVIFELQHLRYLTIACVNLKRLPESLTRLQNLQTLKLINSSNLVELPKGMKRLKNLHFLEIESCKSLVSTPPGLGELTCLQKLSFFIVGLDSAHHIDQLKDLNLGGHLSIKELDYVRNFEDAKSANLMAKINLTSLSLSWKENIAHLPAEYHEKVLNGLQPNQNLETININFYQGSSFPEWMSTAFLPYLCEITLRSCQKCEQFPPFGEFPSLKHLTLERMDSIKRLGAEWNGNGNIIFPGLTSLTIVGMDNLEEWTKPLSTESFPCLTDLFIRGCPKLCGIPYLPTLKYLTLGGMDSIKRLGAEWNGNGDGSFPALTRLIIGNMDNLEEWTKPLSTESFSCLTYLFIYECPKLCGMPNLPSLRSLNMMNTSLLESGFLQKHNALKSLRIRYSSAMTLENELDNLSALQTLDLSNFANLEILPQGLKHLNSLETLRISHCDSLVSIPAILFQGLSSFKELKIEHCYKLKYLLSGPLSSTLTLQSLHINRCPEMELLLDSIQHLIAFRSLRILFCAKLCSLPNLIGSFQSLSKIEIWYCMNLKSLPDSFGNLKSLRKLVIEGCPLLKKRCQKPDGEDWQKISHISDIWIPESTIPKFSYIKSHLCHWSFGAFKSY